MAAFRCNELKSTAELVRLYLTTPPLEDLKADPNFVQKMWEVETLFEDLVKRQDLPAHLSVTFEGLRIYRRDGYVGKFSLIGRDLVRLQLQLINAWVEMWCK